MGDGEGEGEGDGDEDGDGDEAGFGDDGERACDDDCPSDVKVKAKPSPL